jgi:hypothetical protein
VSGKIEKARFVEARTQLKADLELYLMLQSASSEDVPDRDALVEVAWDAVQRSAEIYADAGAAIGYGPERAARPPAGLMSARPQAQTAAGQMSTEDLMRLVAEDSEGEK